MTISASQRITEVVTSWPGVTAGTGRRGEWSFQVGQREIGHLHGDHAAQFSFPKQVWAELVEQGRITDHRVFPGRVGPAARRIKNDADVGDVIETMRVNYDRLVATTPVAEEQTVAGVDARSISELERWMLDSDPGRGSETRAALR